MTVIKNWIKKCEHNTHCIDTPAKLSVSCVGDYYVQNNPPLTLVMSLTKKSQSCCLISFQHSTLHNPLKSPKWLLLFPYSTETLYSLLLYYTHATCQIYIIFLATITLTISDEQWQTLSLLQNLLRPSIPTSLLHQIFSSPPSSHKPSICVVLVT